MNDRRKQYKGKDISEMNTAELLEAISEVSAKLANGKNGKNFARVSKAAAAMAYGEREGFSEDEVIQMGLNAVPEDEK